MDLSGANHDREDLDENGAIGGSRKRLRLDNDSLGSPTSSIGSESPSSSIQSPPTPMPHTPPFFRPPSQSSSSPERGLEPGASQAQPEIPQDMMEKGWRRCWSGRENRWYFFNKLTQESKWDTPVNAAIDHGNGMPQEQPYKRFVPSDEWDLNIASNVRMPERVPLAAFAPHPDMEVIRAQAVTKLRSYATELCHLKEIMEPSPDIFNQWVMERKVLMDYITAEQFLPIAGTVDEVSPALLRLLLSCIPIRMVKFADPYQGRRFLSKYAEAAKKIVDTHNVNAEDRKTVKWNCESMFDWLRKCQYTAKMEDFMGRLSFLRSRCQHVLTETMKPNVEFVCNRLTNHARELASTVLQGQRSKLEACNVKISDEPLPPPRADKIVPCYSVQLRWSCAPLPEIRMEQTRDDQWVKLTYKDETLKIRASHFYKLEQLYKHNCFDDKRYDCYLARVWCVSKRYDTLFNGGLEGVKMQQCVPHAVFEYMRKTWDITFECFSSPFNCYFRQYCSVFADTDGYFGSRGSFFQFSPVSGSMHMHPPYVEEVMNAAIDHAERLLDNAQGPMSFVIFLPDWRDPLLEALVKAERSRFWRCQMTFGPFEHAYRHGFQHLYSEGRRDTYVKSSHGTTVIILQNAAGNETWPADEAKLSKLMEYFRLPMIR